MIAEAPLVLAPSRRWWILLSLALHGIAIALVVGAEARIEQLEHHVPAICISMLVPPPVPDQPCMIWHQSADTVICGRYDRPSRELLQPAACEMPAVLRERPPVVSRIARPGELVRTAGYVPELARHPTLEVCVDAGGAVTWTYPVGSSGDDCLDDAVAVAARNWRFAPLGESACGEVRP